MSAFDNGIDFLRVPGWSEYPAYDLDIVSPELPCGSAWLVNCLLELRVPVFKPWNANLPDEWERLDAYRYRYTRRDEPWQRTLPALRCGRVFDFRARPVPRVHHAWPGFYSATARTILFVRDPRDALYSAWQRLQRSGVISQEVDFCRFAASRYHHYPFSWSEYLLLFLRLWRAATSEKECLIVRYEDYRDDAVATLGTVMRFCGLPVDAAALEGAANVSSFEALQRFETELAAHGSTQSRVNRAGRAREYREVFDERMHAALGPRFASIYAWLGYEEDLSACAALQPPARRDIEPVLRAMQVDQLPPDAQSWLRHHVARNGEDIELIP